ncbi:hypothetical protein [Streptomyces sp. Ag109_O5-10]|uniref:hypothetical protein n=1 Tax=Streptomyces sp. Ag109_O5-10 TaxID=1855349 RepID=UPI00089C66D9|nr:hypothetical protein [Streptomyces sp. Ag109_O5-10]SEE79068.1 hypothetical protein SAMN05216533_3698 [Streptomyces sp. Ag109_O5-10]
MRERFATPRRGSARPLAALLAAVGITAGVLIGRPGLETVTGCGGSGDLYPSQTAKDWVSYADHVVVGGPTGERETNRRTYTEGAVAYSTDRLVTFRTERTVWSRASPRHALGATFDLVAPGWKVYRSSGTRVAEMATDAPRFQTGHTYLLALRRHQGNWVVLGEGAAVPFDDHTGDQGEWCGRVLSKEDVAAGERFSRHDDHSLEKALLGQDEQAAERALDRAAGG